MDAELRRFASTIISDDRVTDTNHLIIIHEDLHTQFRLALESLTGKKRAARYTLESVDSLFGNQRPKHLVANIHTQAAAVYSEAGYELPKVPIAKVLTEEPAHPLSRLVCAAYKQHGLGCPASSLLGKIGMFVTQIFLFDSGSISTATKTAIASHVERFMPIKLNLPTRYAELRSTPLELPALIASLNRSRSQILVSSWKALKGLEEALLREGVRSLTHDRESIQVDPSIPQLASLSSYLETREPRYITDLYKQLFRKSLHLSQRGVLWTLTAIDSLEANQLAEFLITCEFSDDPLRSFMYWRHENLKIEGALFEYIDKNRRTDLGDLLPILLSGEPALVELILPTFDRSLPADHLISITHDGVPEDAWGRYTNITRVNLTDG
ncbi:MAG: hypothetical protein GKR90_25380 [Pseudomonadales bacterium]|nr:hypothetical protein [Pseudomonadales bacterium]